MVHIASAHAFMALTRGGVVRACQVLITEGQKWQRVLCLAFSPRVAIMPRLEPSPRRPSRGGWHHRKGRSTFLNMKREGRVKLLIFVLLSMLIVSCAWQRPKKFVGEDGKEFYRIECKHKVDECNAKASEVCPGGYDTVHTFSLPMTYCMTGITHKSEIFYVEIECK